MLYLYKVRTNHKSIFCYKFYITKKYKKMTTSTVISFNTTDGPKQSTLTQIYKRDEDEESSVEEMLSPINPNKRRKNTKTKGRVTVKASKKIEGNLFEIGDLVMSTAGEINHTAVEDKLISPSYIFLGCVTGWRTRKWACGRASDFEHVFVNWMTIEAGGHRYQDFKDGNPLYDDNCRLLNIFVNYDFIHTNKLHLVAGANVAEVPQMNGFIEDLAYENFKHGTKRGWMKILPSE